MSSVVGVTAGVAVSARVAAGAALAESGVDCARRMLAPLVVTLLATAGSAGFGFGTNSLACLNSTGVTSWRETITRTPSWVTGHSLAAKSCDKRMQPCEAG